LTEKVSLWRRPGAKVLASKSAIRRQLLQAAGLPVEIRVAPIDERREEEDFLAQGGSVGELARALAGAKVLAASHADPDALCIGADQTLTMENRLWHKSETRAAAAATLTALAGKSHELTSAAAVARGGRILFETQDRARMHMRRLDAAEVERYLDRVGPSALASVGVYQIEALGVHLFERIEGDHATILGLPLTPLLGWLRTEGWIGL
jgi:septum formation protein